MLNPPSEEVRNEGPLPKKLKARVPAAEILPSERFTFPVHLDVLKRFVSLSHNGSQPVDASRTEGEGVPIQGASLNVRFLKSVGLLKSTDRGQYLPTQDAINFVLAKSVSDDRARPILSGLIERTWIASNARSVLSPSRPTKEDALLGELAIAAQTDKEKKEASLKVLVDYLLFSGIVRRVPEGLLLTNQEPADTESTSQAGSPISSPLSGTDDQEGTPRGWHIIQTEDFALRIRSHTEAVDDLLEYLKTLRSKIERHQKSEMSISAKAMPDVVN